MAKGTAWVIRRVWHRQPFVAAGAVADEERRQAAHGTLLEILPQRHLTRGEEADVAPNVGIGEVLRADIEELQGLTKLLHVPCPVQGIEGVQLAGGAEAGELDAERAVGRAIQAYDRSLIAARYDQGRGGDGDAVDFAVRGGGHQVIEHTVAGPVVPELLRQWDDRLAPPLEDRAQPARGS